MPAQDVSAAFVHRILLVRGQRVVLDFALASLYGVPVRHLNQQIRRNRRRFPSEFAFYLEINDMRNLKSQIVISSWGGRRKPPLVFTEHGAIMAATVLNSPRAVEMSVHVVRAFVKLRQVLASNEDLARKLAALEKSLAELDAGTRKQFEELYKAIQALITPAQSPSRPIGFTADIERKG